MSAAVPFVFISACTRDLQQARLVLRDALLSLGCHPVLQDHFEVTPGEPIVAKLRRKLETCDYVIHLAGKCYGAAPSERHDGEERSYTQIEYHLAQELQIKTFAFLCAPDFPYAPEDPQKYPQPESPHQRDLQQSHCDMLRRRPLNPEYARISSVAHAAELIAQYNPKFAKLTDSVLASDKETREQLSRIEALIRSGQHPDAIWNQPRRAARLFGRVQESADVRQLLADHGRVAILGSGGKGKTALAAEVLHQLGPPAGHTGPYARRLLLHDYYSSPAHDAALPLLLTQVRVNPDGLTTEQMTAALRTQLGQPGTHLYLEGCEKAEYLSALTTLAGGAVILLTTRDPIAPDGFTGYSLPQLSDQEGADLISSLAPAAGDCVPLARFLGGHALACRQAGQVLARRGWGAEKLLTGLKNESLEKLGGVEREHESISYLLRHTWDLAESASRGCAAAWTVLALGAFAPLPYSLLLTAAGLEENTLDTALDTLQRAGIARVEPIISGYAGETEAHWSLDHPLMREFVLHQRSPHRPLADSLYPAWRDAWIDFLQACLYAKIMPGGWPRYERLVPHFDSLLETITLREAPDALVQSQALTSVALMHSQHGRLALAEGYYRKNAAWCSEHLGPDDRIALYSLQNLASLLYERGGLDEAEPFFRRAVETLERTLGPEHPETLNSLNSLASLLGQRGALDEAEPLHRRALDTRERTLGSEHLDTLISLTNLASLLDQRGALEEAEPLHRRALETCERTLGPEHPHTLTSLNSLANLLYQRGALDEAEPLYRRALEARERTLGPEHPDTLTSLNNLGALRGKQSRLEEAEALYARAVAGAQKLLLPEHLGRQIYERNLADARAALGNGGA